MLDAEPHIRARLENIAGCRGVHGMTDMDRGIASGRQLPCLFVGFDGYTVNQVQGQSAGAQLAVRWLIVVAGRNVADIRDGRPARGTVSAIAGAVFSRLLGWRPPGCQALRPVNGYRPVHENGLILVPIPFEALITVAGEGG